MPIYEYRRPDGTTFEVLQKFSEDALTHDPDSGVPVQRVLHAPAIHFKGSGFHNTDYGTKTRPVGGGNESSASSGTDGGSSGSSDGGSSSGGGAESTGSSSTSTDGGSSSKSDSGAASPAPAPASAG